VLIVGVPVDKDMGLRQTFGALWCLYWLFKSFSVRSVPASHALLDQLQRAHVFEFAQCVLVGDSEGIYGRECEVDETYARVAANEEITRCEVIMRAIVRSQNQQNVLY